MLDWKLFARRTAGGLGVIGAAVLAAGCGELGETRLAISTGPGIDRGGPRDAAVVGHWTRLVYLSDGAGTLHSSRTTWSFRPDGSATRLVIATNLTAGLSSVVATDALWRAEGRTLAITFLNPAVGTIRLEYRVQGDVLFLGGERFERVVTR